MHEHTRTCECMRTTARVCACACPLVCVHVRARTCVCFRTYSWSGVRTCSRKRACHVCAWKCLCMCDLCQVVCKHVHARVKKTVCVCGGGGEGWLTCAHMFFPVLYDFPVCGSHGECASDFTLHHVYICFLMWIYTKPHNNYTHTQSRKTS